MIPSTTASDFRTPEREARFLPHASASSGAELTAEREHRSAAETQASAGSCARRFSSFSGSRTSLPIDEAPKDHAESSPVSDVPWLLSGLRRVAVATLAALGTVACSSAAPWSAEPSPSYDEDVVGELAMPDGARRGGLARYRVHSIGRSEPESPVDNPEVVVERVALARTEGKVLGQFRNTYYDFPSEAEFTYEGELTPLYDSSCQVISKVVPDFHDSLCVQGSGVLSTGQPVSFARRDCSCARACPRTDQKICYDRLDKSRFPWGRGAGGKAITPLLTIAVDSDVIPLDTPVYIPEYEGLPRDLERSTRHDGCFIAQDRGLKVKGEHVDVFTGEPALTRLWNRLMPSNKGVTVVIGATKCARAQ